MNKELKEQAREIMCANLIAFEETTDPDKKAELRPKVILENLDSLIDKTVLHEQERLLAELIEIEEWKRRGDMHPMWNKAKKNTIQELQAYGKDSLITNKSDINKLTE